VSQIPVDRADDTVLQAWINYEAIRAEWVLSSLYNNYHPDKLFYEQLEK